MIMHTHLEEHVILREDRLNKLLKKTKKNVNERITCEHKKGCLLKFENPFPTFLLLFGTTTDYKPIFQWIEVLYHITYIIEIIMYLILHSNDSRSGKLLTQYKSSH